LHTYYLKQWGLHPPYHIFLRCTSLSLSLSLTYTRLARASRKKSVDSGKSKRCCFLQQEDYHYGYWGISYKEWTTLTYPLSFLLVCREYVLRSKQVNKGHWSGKENGTTFVRSPGKINCGIWGCMIFKFQFHLH